LSLAVSRSDLSVSPNSDARCQHSISASIQVLRGVAKWRHRVLLLKLCVATAILPE